MDIMNSSGEKATPKQVVSQITGNSLLYERMKQEVESLKGSKDENTFKKR